MSDKTKILALLFIILFFLFINLSSAEASYLTSSKYEVEIIIDYSREIISDPININANIEYSFKKWQEENENITL